jgi:choline dehydrogenase
MDAASYGSSGEMRLGFMLTQQNHTFYQSLQQAWAHLGQKTNPDLNGGVTEGAAVSPLTFDPQQDRRWDAATAFLWPVENRPNLHLLNGTVTRILWKSDGGEDSAVASGVEYLTPKKTRQKIYINREVILSASVYRTPLILERSGVGNPVILSKLGIPLVVDLPGVGENFVDQSCLADEFDTHPNIHGGSPFVSFMTAASLFGANASQIADDVDSQISSWAEQLAAVGPSGGPSAAMLERLFRLQHRLIFAQNVTLSEIFYTAYAGKIISVAAITMPFSRGSIHWGAMPSDDDDMSDRKFMAKVVMNPRYLTNPFDIQNLIATGRLASRLSSTAPLSLLANDDLDKTNRPPSLELPPAWDDSDGAWRQWTSASVESHTHGMGTAAMMAQELGGVVDERLRVYGTRGLRVVDASVLPMQVSGHPMATVYAVVERAAQMIKEDAEN